ncbi:MAG: glucuronate isomerase, partial [Acidimicrobiales bacterium]
MRAIARALYEQTRALPLISPHGHCDPAAFADDAPIGDPATELVTRDHYLLRMLYSQGVPLEALGVSPRDGSPAESDGKRIWRTFAEHIRLFRGTPSKLWLDHTLAEVFEVEKPLEADTADAIYDHLVARLADDAFRPRALYERFGIEFLATTDAATDELEDHVRLRDSG